MGRKRVGKYPLSFKQMAMKRMKDWPVSRLWRTNSVSIALCGITGSGS